MDDKHSTLVTVAALATFSLLLLSIPAHALAFGDVDPIATAQAAERQAQQERWRADQAQSTADAAYAEATHQAVEATAQAQATQTAWAMQATATAARATAQAQATHEALQVEATRQAISAQATTAAHQHQAVATAQAQALQATATQQAAWAELGRLEIERSHALQPLYIFGPWLIAGALVMAIGAALLRTARATGSDCHDDIIEGEYRLPPETTGPQPCVLRPIPRWKSKRPIND